MKQFAVIVWPIQRSETIKFLSITALVFCILFIQNLIRALKDSIVNTIIGTETIAFLKFWGVLPAAFVITVVYVKLVNVLRGEKIFYIIVSGFLAFFAIFAFVIFPNQELLHLSPDRAQSLIVNFPHLKWFILLVSKWSFSLFYIIAELWPNTVHALLFWQFVNQITTTEQSKRFYVLFGLLGQSGLFISGKFLQYLPNLSKSVVHNYGTTFSGETVFVQLLLSVVLFMGLVTLFSFWFINRYVIDAKQIQFHTKKKAFSVAQSLKMVAQSRYIMMIVTLLICYGVAINLVEGPWKAKAAELYPDTQDNIAFIGSYLSYNGVLTIFFVIIGSNIVRHLGWFVAALITPIMLFVTGITFFLFANFSHFSNLLMMIFPMDPLILIVVIGAIQNVLTKSTKYTVFDSTKEMAYVPLNDELKAKGKAAADVIGTKFGKSFSSLLQSIVFIMFPAANYQKISVYLMIVFTIVCVLWIWAIWELNKEYKSLTKTEKSR